MNEKEIVKNLKDFCDFYKDKGYEKGDSQPFWLTLLSCLGVENPNKYISFEDQVILDHTSFIDGFIETTHVLIEQKGKDKNLDKAIKQSDGSLLTPFQQAKRYSSELPFSKRPRWIVVCNFQEFRIYDMETPNAEPGKIKLEDLPKEYYRLKFLVDEKSDRIKQEVEVSVQAGEIVGKLYNALLKQYIDPDDPETLKSINVLCVRLVFCMYAEDAGIFGKHGMFSDFLKQYNADDIRDEIIKLFEVLNTPEDARSKYLKPSLAAFPYVNGGLFAKEDIEIPNFCEEIISLLVDDAGEEFDWRNISPTVFGACFESTLNPDTRRSGGMHYTSIENIHKVIDPLFLNDLQKELNDILELQAIATKKRKLEAFQLKLAGLNFMDPACGSGNFLTETYLCLRRMENTVIAELIALQKGLETGQIRIGEGILNPIKVSIGQFSGIEINDFAVSVAKTALWIAESQMMQETEKIIHFDLDFLPLKTDANIVEGNALTMDWNDVCDKNELDYIMGNPPFVGARLMSKTQKKELFSVFGSGWKNVGNLDYVSCWYKKSADYILETSIRVALVSTNSVTQGETVANLWEPLFNSGISIDFAHRTFIWDSEAQIKAHVHCVIVGYSCVNKNQPKLLFDCDRYKICTNINGYLVDAPNIFITKRNYPLCEVPKLYTGCQRLDNDNFMFSPQEKEEFLKKEPFSEKYFFRWFGADEFINNKERWCLRLSICPPNELKKMSHVLEIVQNVRDYRLNSNREQTKKYADRPTEFYFEIYSKDDFLVIPVVSSERRRYVPIGFMKPGVLCSNQANIIPNATLFHFGVLTSNVHNAWMRMVAGRLKSDYRYSKDIVYNNFPWPTPTDRQKALIEKTAQAILDARANHPESSLADLYDPLTMPGDLLEAHRLNDKAVMAAYGLPKGISESDCVAHLMKMYKELTEEK